MGIATQVLGFLLSLTFLIFTHELGHLFFARLFKTRVDKFYLFFNPGFSIMRMKKVGGKFRFSFFSSNPPEEWAEEPDNTEWGLGWLPLGGYCSINGMVDETTKPGELPEEPQPYEFRSKPAWQRFFIISGGVLVNFISAMVIFIAVLYAWGEEYIPLSNAKYGIQFTEVAKNMGFQDGDNIISVNGYHPKDVADFSKTLLLDNVNEVTIERHGEIATVNIPKDVAQQILKAEGNFCKYNHPFVIGAVSSGSPAEKAGLQAGDSIVGVNDNPYISLFSFQGLLAENKGQPVLIEYYRAGIPAQDTVVLDDNGLLGVALKGPESFFSIQKELYTFTESIPKGIEKGVNTLGDYVKQFKLIASKEGAKQLGGFITIGSIFPETWDWQRFWTMTGFLAIVLAFMNILPIPALDGGYLVFILAEMITRRKPSEKLIGYANMIGFSLLILLLLYANGMDLVRVFIK